MSLILCLSKSVVRVLDIHCAVGGVTSISILPYVCVNLAASLGRADCLRATKYALWRSVSLTCNLSHSLCLCADLLLQSAISNLEQETPF